jgi:hypothetical protein
LIVSGKLSGESTNIYQGATLLSVIFPSYGIMAHWEQMYPSIDFRSFQGYPNYFDTKWLNNSPTFLGLPTSHIVNFLEYLSEIKLGGVFERDKVGRRGFSYKIVLTHSAILLTSVEIM